MARSLGRASVRASPRRCGFLRLKGMQQHGTPPPPLGRADLALIHALGFLGMEAMYNAISGLRVPKSIVGDWFCAGRTVSIGILEREARSVTEFRPLPSSGDSASLA